MKKNILKNVLSLFLVELFLVFMYFGYKNLKFGVFLTDLRVFAMLILFLAIYIFERAYKKDSGILAITGIEVLVLAIVTLLLPNSYYGIEKKIINLDVISMIAFLIYYIIKTVIQCLCIEFKEIQNK